MSAEITTLLMAWSDGNHEALDELMPLVNRRLQALAASFLRSERADHTLQTAALVNEAFLKLIDQDQVRWRDRAHFFALAGRMMRRILVDHARSAGYAKRGGGFERVSEEALERVPVERPKDLVALDEALSALAELDPEQARIVEMRYFGGLTKEEIAVVIGISRATVTRRWRLARAWLFRTLVQGETDDL
ncbi:MAG: sigma-70 family RNA polymerase sigma factor [Acidobacteriota bacterium]